MTSADVMVTIAASVLSALGTGGILAAWFRYRLARERLDVIEGPAAAAQAAQAANDLLMRQLEAQEQRHREDRREYRDEVNGLRDTVSRMGARMDAMRELIDERDATIDTMRRDHDRELRAAHDECEALRLQIASLESELADLRARYDAAPKRASDRAATVVVANDPATAAAAVEAAKGGGR